FFCTALDTSCLHSSTCRLFSLYSTAHFFHMLSLFLLLFFFFFFFNDPATTDIYTLSLHDALPICSCCSGFWCRRSGCSTACCRRSEEHTSELQSHLNLVCRLLLEKKKKKY